MLITVISSVRGAKTGPNRSFAGSTGEMNMVFSKWISTYFLCSNFVCTPLQPRKAVSCGCRAQSRGDSRFKPRAYEVLDLCGSNSLKTIEVRSNPQPIVLGEFPESIPLALYFTTLDLYNI